MNKDFSKMYYINRKDKKDWVKQKVELAIEMVNKYKNKVTFKKGKFMIQFIDRKQTICVHFPTHYYFIIFKRFEFNIA